MPKPPILPVIDWQAVFDSGKTYSEWIADAENKENASKMEIIRASLALEPHVAGLLKNLSRPVHVIAIAEDWCGDVVRHAPVLARLADEGPNLKVRFIEREQHPDVFIRFLTNGGEAIPKFVFLSADFTECGNWGPMPDACREVIARGKACGDVGAARKKTSGMYEADANLRDVMSELVHLVDIAASERI
ncbi:MAG: hypothetical protein GWP08_09060 [Nitrospiraceae bacterium]|nr:hypothetical protein [Nitrospiraceae bacterium]